MPEYKCNISFTNKVLGFINVARMLSDREIIDS